MDHYDDILSDNSYNEETHYSDQVDSDIETELYGLIHHDSQANSIQDKSVENMSVFSEGKSVESTSVFPEDKPGSTDNNSTLLLKSLSPTVGNFATSKDTVKSTNILKSLSPTIGNSATFKDTVKSTKKLKNIVKNNPQNYNTPVKSDYRDLFCSDTIKNNTLYFSFESPPHKQIIKNNLERNKNSRKNQADLPAKRKSDVVSEILESIQSTNNLNSNSMMTENSNCKKKKINHDYNSVLPEDSFVEVIDDTSDSDSSIILLEHDPSDFKTNIEKETVVLISDSEDSDSSVDKSLSQACQRKQTTTSNANLSLTNKDPWQINSEDQFRTRKKSNRYHESIVVTCSKCHLKGHSAKFCTIPTVMKCFFCGGFHSGMQCKNKICTKCFCLGHGYRHCYKPIFDHCYLCGRSGHPRKNCPDLWRRYHLTTSRGRIVKGNPNPDSPLYCYNCGLRGHYGSVCIQLSKIQMRRRTWTSVVSYEHPQETIKLIKKEERRKFQERNNIERTPLFHMEPGNEMFSIDTPRQKKKKKKSKTPDPNHQSAARPINAVQNEVYFPRTPKTPDYMTPSTSTERLNSKNCKRWKNKRKFRLNQQEMHQIGLHQRLGLPDSSTI